MPAYLHATLTAKPGRLDELGDTVARVSQGMQQRGMRLLGALRTVGTEPGGMVDLWEVPDANTVIDALDDAARHPAHPAVMARLARSLDDEVLQILQQEPGAPPLDLSAGVGWRHRQLVHRVRYGEAGAVQQHRRAELDHVQRATGWTLVGSFTAAIGSLCDLYEIWRTPGATSASTDAALEEASGAVLGCTRTELALLPWSVPEDVVRP
jgi:hypothetical protein